MATEQIQGLNLSSGNLDELIGQYNAMKLGAEQQGEIGGTVLSTGLGKAYELYEKGKKAISELPDKALKIQERAEGLVNKTGEDVKSIIGETVEKGKELAGKSLNELKTTAQQGVEKIGEAAKTAQSEITSEVPKLPKSGALELTTFKSEGAPASSSTVFQAFKNGNQYKAEQLTRAAFEHDPEDLNPLSSAKKISTGMFSFEDLKKSGNDFLNSVKSKFSNFGKSAEEQSSAVSQAVSKEGAELKEGAEQLAKAGIGALAEKGASAAAEAGEIAGEALSAIAPIAEVVGGIASLASLGETPKMPNVSLPSLQIL